MTRPGLQSEPAARRQLADRLIADPLYQLSTAGQELFHTNMLYWLAGQRPRESSAVWTTLGAEPPMVGEYQPLIRREWQHVDLYVDCGLGRRKLVLENKILAIPTSAQLAG